jgi:hypothetical protein
VVALRVRSLGRAVHEHSTQDAAKDADLNSKYDVIIFGPGGGSAQSVIQGVPM